MHIKRGRKRRKGGVREGEKGEERCECEIPVREKRNCSSKTKRTDCIFPNSSNTYPKTCFQVGTFSHKACAKYFKPQIWLFDFFMPESFI